jgi:hypothetical protein
MYRQATLGEVDFITGDYLAGMFSFWKLAPGAGELFVD